MSHKQNRGIEVPRCGLVRRSVTQTKQGYNLNEGHTMVYNNRLPIPSSQLDIIPSTWSHQRDVLYCFA